MNNKEVIVISVVVICVTALCIAFKTFSPFVWLVVAGIIVIGAMIIP